MRMAAYHRSRELQEHGVVVLRGAFANDSLNVLRDSAARCFQTITAAKSIPEAYRFSPSSHSVLLPALLDFGCDRLDQLTAPLSGLAPLFSDAMGLHWTCNMEQSWVRKKFAPRQVPAPGYHLQNWHQDGALGVRFPSEPGPVIPMTDLLTCWIPLTPCGIDSPGLEFVRRRQPALLHFTELDDSTIRQRFPPHEFCAPALEFGDGLAFLNDILHCTHVTPEMQYDRLSVEYRIFPR
jgi:hypothetical protein